MGCGKPLLAVQALDFPERLVRLPAKKLAKGSTFATDQKYFSFPGQEIRGS